MKKSVTTKIMTIGTGVLLMGLMACGTPKEKPEPVSGTVTVTVAPETEATVTEQPQATEVPKPTVTPTPVPTHAPARIEGVDIPAEYRKTKKEAEGTVEEISYQTKDYYGTGEEYTKHAYVYLPHGYDESKQYNVLFLMHSGGGDEAEWGLQLEFSAAKLALDNLIYYGDIEPLIVVTPNGRTGEYIAKKSDSSNGFKDFGKELREDLIPYIDANYATYAEYNPESYDATEARMHRAIAGFSFGAMQAINIGLCECCDLIGYYGAFSPATAVWSAETIAECLENFEPYDIGYIYEVCGDQDTHCLAAGYYALYPLPTLTDKVVLDENLLLQIVPGSHETKVGRLGLYNFLQLIFK